MKNMKQKLLNNMKQSAVNTIGEMILKTGEAAIDTYCLFWMYEPEVPEELLRRKEANK